MALKISVSFTSLHLTVNKQLDVRSSLSFVDLVAANIRLDPDSKNLYFVQGNPNALELSLADLPVLDIFTNPSDSLSISEQSIFTFNSAKSDTVGIGENFSRVVSFVRAFTDEPTLIDSPAISFSTISADSYTLNDAPVLEIEPEKSDSFAMSDSETLSVDPEKSETVSITDSPALSSSIPQSDSTTVSEDDLKEFGKAIPAGGTTETVAMSESLSRTVVYTRAFADAYTLDDVASPSDDLRTDFDINKGNILSIAESLNYDISTTRSDVASLVDSPSIEFVTAFSDSITLSELLTSGVGSIYTDSASLLDEEVISFSKALSDSASITESINVVLISGLSSVLNTGAFNTSVLN
jgi:hypothetical protein